LSDVDTYGYGQLGPDDVASDYNAFIFLISQALARVRTVTLVSVVEVTSPTGPLAPVGFLTAQPLVNMMDGNGNCTQHGTIFNLPYFRLQGGKNAVVIDPQPGDIGISVISDRDISSVKNNLGISNPGSTRLFDLADGIYIGGILNGIPTNYIWLDLLGNINAVCTGAFNITAPGGLIVNGTPVTLP
jgi:hypothetical protein